MRAWISGGLDKWGWGGGGGGWISEGLDKWGPG